MTIFPNTNPVRLAPGSFQQPISLPAHQPDAPDLVTVCFNKDWLPVVLGCLIQSTLATTWQASTDADLNTALQEANQLILIFQQALAGCQTQNPAFAGAGDDFMLRQNPDNPCLLETSVDGTNWCVWADLSKCTGQPQQPGKGSTQPSSGGCANFFGTVEFGSRWMLPNNVSAGDVITVTDAIGTWASALDLFIPRCPDGNIFFEVGCVDGSGHTEPGDPAPAINHDSLIAFDGTNYYDCGAASDNTPVVITIPSGITAANLFFFANTPDTSGFGAVNFNVKYCNNAVANWSHVFDLTTSPGPFSVVPVSGGTGSNGVWTAGTGFKPGTFDDGPGTEQFRIVHVKTGTLAPFILDTVTMYFDLTVGTFHGSGDISQEIITNNGGAHSLATVDFATAVSGSGQNLAAGASPANQTSLELYLISGNGVPTLGTPGDCTLTKVVVTGHGPDPFGM